MSISSIAVSAVWSMDRNGAGNGAEEYSVGGSTRLRGNLCALPCRFSNRMIANDSTTIKLTHKKATCMLPLSAAEKIAIGMV